jgi:hypothetical protein
MMNNDYAQGFKDGFAAGLEEGKKLAPRAPNWNELLVGGEKIPTTSPKISLHETCPKCGIKIGGVMGYVCGSINCPTFLKTSCVTTGFTGLTAGAVGAAQGYVPGYNEAGANGPADPGHNSVWINGKWTELGN